MILLLVSLSKVPSEVVKPNYFKPVLILIFNSFLFEESIAKKSIAKNQKQIWEFILKENNKKGFILKSLRQKDFLEIKNRDLNKKLFFFYPLVKSFLRLIFLVLKILIRMR